MCSSRNTTDSDFQKALSSLERGQFLDAKKMCEDILKDDPNHFDALHLSGLMAAQGKYFDQAISFLTKALHINPHIAGLHMNLANIFFELNRYDDALFGYEKAITLDPQNEKAYYNQGRLLERLNRHDEALRSYRKAVLVKADYAEALNNIGNILQKNKMYEEALKIYV